MKNSTLAEVSRQIPYLPVLRPYCHSVLGCILMQKLDYWFSSKNGDTFYKFLNPQFTDMDDPLCQDSCRLPSEFLC